MMHCIGFDVGRDTNLMKLADLTELGQIARGVEAAYFIEWGPEG